MPSMTLNKIQQAVFDRVEAATGLLPIKYQHKAFNHNGSPYVEMIVSPLDTRAETIDGGDIMPGFIGFNVYVPSDYGVSYPASEGQKFVDLFPRDLRFDGVYIVDTGTIRASVEDDEVWRFTPVLIPYEADSCAHQTA